MCSHLMKITQRSMTRGKALAISVANSVVDSGKCWVQTRWASSNVTSYVVPTILNPESMGIYKWIFSKLDGNLSNSKMQVSLGISYNWGKLKPMLRWSEWSYWEEYISFRCNCRSPNAWRSRSQADWRGEAVRLSLTTLYGVYQGIPHKESQNWHTYSKGPQKSATLRQEWSRGNTKGCHLSGHGGEDLLPVSDMLGSRWS